MEIRRIYTYILSWSQIELRILLLLFVGASAIFICFDLLSEQIRAIDYEYTLSIPVANRSEEIALFSTCPLAELGDGWTDELMLIADVNLNPVEFCDRNFSTFTVLGENGTVWLNPEKMGLDLIRCKARAIYPKDERDITYGPWSVIERTPSTVVFDSDFVQTSCTGIDEEEFVHLQIWNVTESKNRKNHKIDEKPSVFIFVLDSVSSSQGQRALPKTISLLESEFNAVNMRHVNRVGENSHPNGIAFLIGKLITDLDRGIFGLPKEKADWNETYACHRHFDDEPFILKEFTKKGYKSLMAEDWRLGVFNWPDCWGFKKAPVTRYMRPFQIHYERNLTKSRKYMGEAQCLEYHTFLLNYLTKFIAAYKDSPLISLVWASELGHDNEDLLFHADSQFSDYFTKHKEVFDKSYVFFMGDHGKRYGEETDTWIGQREINNPMLFMSVPRHLRKRINPIMKTNSDKLLTHFDVHASFVDILNEPSLQAESGPSGLRGNSLFRPLPPGERSCRTLPIPVQFCLCEWNKTDSKGWSLFAHNDIGKATVNLLNKKLEELEITDKCRSFTLGKTEDLKLIERTDGLADIFFTTPECDSEFKAMVRIRRMEGAKLNVTLASNGFRRTNGYGSTADCMNHRASVKPICCCRWWAIFD